MPEYRELRLRFVAEPGIVSGAIRWFGSGLYAHVGAVTDDGLYEMGARLHVDAAVTGRPGVQRRPLAYARFSQEASVRIPCTTMEHAAFWAALSRAEDKPYSTLEILGDVLAHDFRKEGRFDCSALIHWALTEARMTDYDERGRSRLLTPDWLYAYTSGLRNGRRWHKEPAA